MNVTTSALKAPSQNSLSEWLDTPRPAKCGGYFTPSNPRWWPDKSAPHAIYWQPAIHCVTADFQPWLHAALAFRMSEVSQGTVMVVSSVLSRAAQAGLNPLDENHLIDLRERFSDSDFSSLASFIRYWEECESLEIRPPKTLTEAYTNLPRKKKTKIDVILSLDPEEGPFIQTEQDALYQWTHEQFCHGNLDTDRYLYLCLAMTYGQRGVQFRMMTFGDFIRDTNGYYIRLFRAKQRGLDAGWRVSSELFNLDEDLFNIIELYKANIQAQLEHEYPEVDWHKAIKNVPLFRRKVDDITTHTGPIPTIINKPNLKSLEQAPDASFHAAKKSIHRWLEQIERMPGYPISPRTHQPLKITNAHRFKHTIGTDLSNAGLDEWAIASALMHSKTNTVRKYRAISAELMNLIDTKMSDHLALVVGAFSGSIVKDRKSAVNGDRADRLIEDLAVCGADSICHLDAPFSCYGCIKFQPFLDADHGAALTRLERRREQTIATDKTTGVLWDRAILACRKVILDCNSIRAKATEAPPAS